MRLLIRLGLMLVAVWLTFTFVPGLDYDGSWFSLLVLAVLLGVANAFIIPLLKLISLPVRVVTLGLVTLAINVLVIVGVIALAESIDLGISSDGFWTNVLAALVLTVLSSIVSFLVKD
jgi:putative membrane protein